MSTCRMSAEIRVLIRIRKCVVSDSPGALLFQIDLIVGSENGKASSTDILNSVDSMIGKKLKKSETEHLLNRLVQDKWLNEVKRVPSIQLLFAFLKPQALFCGFAAAFLRDTSALS